MDEHQEEIAGTQYGLLRPGVRKWTALVRDGDLSGVKRYIPWPSKRN